MNNLCHLWQRSLSKSILIAMLLSIPMLAMALPAKKGITTIVQPDGRSLSVKATGNARTHRVFTSDNIPLLHTDKYGYVYATVDDNGGLVASEIAASNPELRTGVEKTFIAKLNNSAVENAFAMRFAKLRSSKITPVNYPEPGTGLCTTSFPAYGRQRAIAILVEFKNVGFTVDNPKDYFNRLLNEEGFSDNGATGSVRDWFVENSCGKFTPEFDVYGPVTLSHNRRYYGSNDKWGEDQHADEMIVEACQLVDDIVDFSKYDRDNDGFIDNVYVFYAGYGEADSRISETVWPHSWDMSEAGNTVYKFDNVTLEHYATSNELDYSTGKPETDMPAGIGTFVHEFSHVLGLPDLYNTGSESVHSPGEYSVLDYGPYNNDGRTPPNYSSYERFALKWLSPDFFNDTDQYTLNPLHESNKAFIIPTEKDNEYFMLENRQQEGNDKYLPGHGMLIWHVDYNKTTWDYNEVNNTADHQGVDLIEADNKANDATLSADPFPGTDNVTSFSYTTKPALKSWAGNMLFVSLSDIKEENRQINFFATIDSTIANNLNACEEDQIKVENGVVYTSSITPLPVYDSMGMFVGYVSMKLPLEISRPGLYIVASKISKKIFVK